MGQSEYDSTTQLIWTRQEIEAGRMVNLQDDAFLDCAASPLLASAPRFVTTVHFDEDSSDCAEHASIAAGRAVWAVHSRHARFERLSGRDWRVTAVDNDEEFECIRHVDVEMTLATYGDLRVETLDRCLTGVEADATGGTRSATFNSILGATWYDFLNGWWHASDRDLGHFNDMVRVGTDLSLRYMLALRRGESGAALPLSVEDNFAVFLNAARDRPFVEYASQLVERTHDATAIVHWFTDGIAVEYAAGALET